MFSQQKFENHFPSPHIYFPFIIQGSADSRYLQVNDDL